MSYKVFIDGAAGTTGLEIAERLAGRDEFSMIVLDDARRKDSGARAEALHEADFAILCLHDDAAREAVAMAQGAKVRIIDASTAHRVAPGWVYGFPEISGRDVVAGADLVSNPGCYSTGFIALIAPLVRMGLLPADWPYMANAVSGYSGGGKALIERYQAERDIAFRAYALGLNHKHVPEMQAQCGLVHAPLFAPSVIRRIGVCGLRCLCLWGRWGLWGLRLCAKVWRSFMRAARWCGWRRPVCRAKSCCAMGWRLRTR